MTLAAACSGPDPEDDNATGGKDVILLLEMMIEKYYLLVEGVLTGPGKYLEVISVSKLESVCGEIDLSFSSRQ